jgi:hypothetical protein
VETQIQQTQREGGAIPQNQEKLRAKVHFNQNKNKNN